MDNLQHSAVYQEDTSGADAAPSEPCPSPASIQYDAVLGTYVACVSLHVSADSTVFCSSVVHVVQRPSPGTDRCEPCEPCELHPDAEANELARET